MNAFPTIEEVDYCESNDLLKCVNKHPEKKITDEKMNLALLFCLYLLQGIPLGLGGSIPMILNNRISYKQQAFYSLVGWPFSMKLLWAPIVDTFFWSRIGRRKSWLVPTQYLIGLTMMTLSGSVTSLLGEDGSPPNVLVLTAAFLFLNFLAATQDVAVDGWALTMLSREHVGYASTCNSVGQFTGYFLGNAVFLALESADICNSYLRSVPMPKGIVSLSSFLMFWGCVFLITTTVVLIFKNEDKFENDLLLNIKGTYKSLYHVMCLPSIWTMIIFLMTCKIGFSATDAATSLKLIEAGVLKEHLALMSLPLIPLHTVLPVVISRYTAGPRPLSVILKTYKYRLACGIMFAVLLSWTYQMKSESGKFPSSYYAVIILAFGIHQVTTCCMHVAQMAFSAKVSDPAIGGTYMTLLNTTSNLGSMWVGTLALWFLDPLTSKICKNANNLTCHTKELAKLCEGAGGHCVTTVDGYYVETAFCVIFGFVWLLKWGRPAAMYLQQLPLSAWSY